MNKLFERFIFVQLRRAEPKYAARGLCISGQVSKTFWSTKTIRPDVVATSKVGENSDCVILDTKWKVPKDGHPADDDLKQMYAYNVHLGGRRSVLVYPMARIQQTGVSNPYAQSVSLPTEYWHHCSTFYINLFDDNLCLRRDIGDELIKKTILNDGLAPYQCP